MTAQANKTRLRVINLGLPKSGTTTLGVALGHAGLKVADWKIRENQSAKPDLEDRFLGDLLYRGYFETSDPLAYLDEFDALTEISVASHKLSYWPQTDWGLLSAIRAHHPGVKFVLSRRDPEQLTKSMKAWHSLGSVRLPNQNVPGLPTGFGASPGALQQWIEGHYAFCRQVFRDDPGFLEYDLGDDTAPQKISAFLGIDLPWWGTANAQRPKKVAAAPIAVKIDATSAPESAQTERRVFLHAGAHRTGTSSFQLFLEHNRQALAMAGFGLATPRRDGVGKRPMRLRLPEPRHNADDVVSMTERARKKMDAHFAGHKRLILSEENLPGRMMHFYDGKFFPALEQRAVVLATALAAPVEHLVFVVRDYASFFISAHRQRAKQRAVKPFKQLRDGVMGLERGWPYVIETMIEKFDPAEVSVIEYAQRGGNRALLDRLVLDAPLSDLGEPEKRLNVSGTDAALIALQESRASGEELNDDQVAEVLSRYQHDTLDRGFACFDSADTVALKDRYARDLEQIARLRNVTLLAD